MRINRIIFLLSLLGIGMAIYVLQSFLRDAPIVCLNSGCDLVRKNPASYLLGIPVPAFGLVGYSLLALLSFLHTTTHATHPSASASMRAGNLQRAMLGISLFGVVFVSWFTYTELFVIKAICTWCAISALNMVIIFIMVITCYKSYKKS